jgi:hypothetical protein
MGNDKRLHSALSSGSPEKPAIEVEVTDFCYHQKGRLVGHATVRLNGKIGVRGVSYFLPSDPAKKPWCGWPQRKEDGPHGPEWISIVWWIDPKTSYRILARIAEAVTKYLLTHPSPTEAFDRLAKDTPVEPSQDVPY